MWSRKDCSVYDACVCPSAVYHERPPSYLWHHAIGWSVPAGTAPVYVDVSVVSRMCRSVLSRGLYAIAAAPPPLTGLSKVWKLYHSSVRFQTAGSVAVEESVESSRSTVPVGVPFGWSLKYAPTSLPYQGQVYSVSAAEWMPT